MRKGKTTTKALEGQGRAFRVTLVENRVELEFRVATYTSYTTKKKAFIN